MSLAGLAGFAEGFGTARQNKNDRERYDRWMDLQESGMSKMGAAPPDMNLQVQIPAGRASGQTSGGGPINIPENLRAGIIQTAERLGMDPVDLATIISYETAGSFDPSKRGPRTQWGQHRGLIQFGEPQAQEYGVNWDDPIGSQLGEGGAVEQYFLKNGWKPGMGMKDAYSIVNAGAPGLYNRSDANNGGAPGTVADKVNTQMGGHRANAMALFGPKPTQSPTAMPALGAVPRQTPPYRSIPQ